MLLAIFEISILFVIPVLLIYFKKINFKYRIHTLIGIVLIALIIISFDNWTLLDLGIRFDNFKIGLIPYSLFTLIGILALLLTSKILKLKPDKNFYKQKHFIFGFIILSILQEFLFRSFLIPKLSLLINIEILIILINALLFTFMHIIYFNNEISLILLFFSGMFFAYLYLNYSNLILISISHSILNYIAVMFGFFSEEK